MLEVSSYIAKRYFEAVDEKISATDTITQDVKSQAAAAKMKRLVCHLGRFF